MPQLAASYALQYILVAASVAYSIKQQRKIKKALKNLGNTQAEAQGRLQTKRDSAAYKQVVYGETRVGGTIILNHNNTTSKANDTKHLIIEFAGHEVESFSNLMLDDELVTLDGAGNAIGRYAGYLQAHYYYGGPAQVALAPVVANCPEVWDADHKLLGSAGVYIRLLHHENLFPNGVPNITVVCRGKKVYDPRSDLTTWSANPALCLADYYCDTKYGLGFDYYSEIDEAELIASANVCDELVTLADDSTERRYSANGSFTADTVHADVIEQFKAAMGGFVIDPPGRVGIVAGYWRPATLPAFDEDTLVEGLSVTTKTPISENCNRVKGMYISPANSWQATDYPPVVNGTYLTQDNNKEMWREISYTFVTSHTQSQRLGKIAMEESRLGKTVRGKGNFAWYQVRAGDVIKFSNTRRGWVEKEFIVDEIGIDTNDQGAMVFPFSLRETAEGVYDWADGEETTVDLAPDTNLPSPFNIAAPSSIVVLSDNTTREHDTTTGEYIPRILVTWTAPADVFVINSGTLQMQFKKVGDTLWKDWSPLLGSQTEEYIFPVVTGAPYLVRMRSLNRLCIHSAWIYSSPTEAGGDTTAPSAPTSFTATGGVGGVYLAWTNPGDSDLAFIEVYEYTANTPAPSSGSTPLVSVGDENENGVIDNTYFRTGLGGGVTRYYWIRAVDSSGNKSAWVGPQGATTVVPISAAASTSVAYGEGTGPGVTTEPVTCIVTGGVAPLAYLWEVVGWDSGAGDVNTFFVIHSPTAATTTFGVVVYGSVMYSYYVRCRVTDSAGGVAYTQTVYTDTALVQE